MESKNEFKVDYEYPFAFIMHDFSATSQQSTGFYVEIKPKSQAVELLPRQVLERINGSEKFANLVNGDVPKFVVTQYSRVHEKKQDSIIDYNPRDLFSGEKGKSALQSLLAD